MFHFPLFQCCIVIGKSVGDRLQLADASISFGQLAVELVKCGSMLGVLIGELHLQPMDSSLGWFEFLHARAQLVGFCDSGV